MFSREVEEVGREDRRRSVARGEARKERVLVSHSRFRKRSLGLAQCGRRLSTLVRAGLVAQ